MKIGVISTTTPNTVIVLKARSNYLALKKSVVRAFRTITNYASRQLSHF